MFGSGKRTCLDTASSTEHHFSILAEWFDFHKCQLQLYFPFSCVNTDLKATYYYNATLRKCVTEHNICYSDHNSFLSKYSCSIACEGAALQARDLPVGDPRLYCSLQPNPGVITIGFPKWYYNLKDNKCESFKYGGIGGNRNRFDSKSHCETTCKPYFVEMMAIKQKTTIFPMIKRSTTRVRVNFTYSQRTTSSLNMFVGFFPNYKVITTTSAPPPPTTTTTRRRRRRTKPHHGRDGRRNVVPTLKNKTEWREHLRARRTRYRASAGNRGVDTKLI